VRYGTWVSPAGCCRSRGGRALDRMSAGPAPPHRVSRTWGAGTNREGTGTETGETKEGVRQGEGLGKGVIGEGQGRDRGGTGEL
jgi:hypothetical protein